MDLLDAIAANKRLEGGNALDLLDQAAAEIERLTAALKLFVGCAYPVAREINPRGHGWRPEGSLDYALGEARKALGEGEQTLDGEAK